MAFLEHGVKFEERVFDVFKPAVELSDLNPLGRVPAVKLASGAVLFDSNLILQAFYESPKYQASEFAPRTDAEKLTVFEWSALATGLIDKCIEKFFEDLRPEAARDRAVYQEVDVIFDRVLPRFEGFITGRTSVLPDRVTQADWDMGIAFAYISLRLNAAWRAKYPACARFADAMDARESFRATVPPPPA